LASPLTLFVRALNGSLKAQQQQHLPPDTGLFEGKHGGSSSAATCPEFLTVFASDARVLRCLSLLRISTGVLVSSINRSVFPRPPTCMQLRAACLSLHANKAGSVQLQHPQATKLSPMENTRMQHRSVKESGNGGAYGSHYVRT
jgi:hypothetical protein